MSLFKFRTLESAPEEARPLLRGKLSQFGFVPHLEAQLAACPAALKAYTTLFEQFENTSLSPNERLIVLLAASVEGRDAFGVAAWTHMARRSGYLSARAIDALRMGDVVGHLRHDVLANLVRQIVRCGGRAQGVPMEAFLAAGYQHTQMIDVLLGVCLATMGAYASTLLQTPLNWELQPEWWIAPLRELAEDTLAPEAPAASLQTRAA